MGHLPWYKRDPEDALNGMLELSLEERGAYNTILDLIYLRDNNLLDDDRFIAGWLRCDVRVWKRIRCTLIDREKLYVSDGRLRNRRADDEIANALSKAVATAELNATKGRKSRLYEEGWGSSRIFVINRDNGVCQYCGQTPDRPDIDHVIPRSRGGSDNPSNLVTACPSCNRSKGARTPDEWFVAMGLVMVECNG